MHICSRTGAQSSRWPSCSPRRRSSASSGRSRRDWVAPSDRGHAVSSPRRRPTASWTSRTCAGSVPCVKFSERVGALVVTPSTGRRRDMAGGPPKLDRVEMRSRNRAGAAPDVNPRPEEPDIISSGRESGQPRVVVSPGLFSRVARCGSTWLSWLPPAMVPLERARHGHSNAPSTTP